MTNLERLVKDLQTTIGRKREISKQRKPRRSTRIDGTNPRAKGTNPRAKKIPLDEGQMKVILVENFDTQDWEEILSMEDRWDYNNE